MIRLTGDCSWVLILTGVLAAESPAVARSPEISGVRFETPAQQLIDFIGQPAVYPILIAIGLILVVGSLALRIFLIEEVPLWLLVVVFVLGAVLTMVSPLASWGYLNWVH